MPTLELRGTLFPYISSGEAGSLGFTTFVSFISLVAAFYDAILRSIGPESSRPFRLRISSVTTSAIYLGGFVVVFPMILL